MTSNEGGCATLQRARSRTRCSFRRPARPGETWRADCVRENAVTLSDDREELVPERVRGSHRHPGFSLPPVQGGDFLIYFKKAGYEDARYWVKELPRDASVDMALVPQHTIVERWSGTLERNGIAGWPGDVVFETRRTSEATLTLLSGVSRSGRTPISAPV
jgi:hypothetical protein